MNAENWDCKDNNTGEGGGGGGGGGIYNEHPTNLHFTRSTGMATQRGGGAQNSNTCHRQYTEYMAHSKAPALVKFTVALTDVNSVLGFLRSVDVGEVADVSVVHVATIFRVEVCKVSELYIYMILF
jgi:hypothetical protein